MKDTRKLLKFERSLGSYAIAGAICSHGDVIDFVNRDKQGIILVDTCGHEVDYGNSMRSFLCSLIEEGWGVQGNAGEELGDLANLLSETDGDWSHFAAGIYAQFDRDVIHLANACMPYPWIFRDSVEELKIMGCRLNQKYNQKDYSFKLDPGDVLFLRSDGLEYNLDFHRSIEEQRADPNQIKRVIQDIISQSRAFPASEIRDSLVSQLEKYFLLGDYGDDVTIVIVKKA